MASTVVRQSGARRGNAITEELAQRRRDLVVREGRLGRCRDRGGDDDDRAQSGCWGEGQRRERRRGKAMMPSVSGLAAASGRARLLLLALGARMELPVPMVVAAVTKASMSTLSVARSSRFN